MRQPTATLAFDRVEGFIGREDPGLCERHPQVREELARQGIDLARPVVAWSDAERRVYCYRNRKEGDPGLSNSER